METSRLARAIRVVLSVGILVGACAAVAGEPAPTAPVPGTTVYTRAAIEQAGYTDLAEFLQDLPSHGTGKTLRFGGPSLEGDTAVDFRRAGIGGTLLLVDGERWLAGLGGSFDLSALPLAAVERVELTLGGQGARAGSHAIGATVNVITRKGFDGAEAGGTFGRFDEGDGERTTADFSIGATGERASASVIVAYSDYDGLLAGARDISVPPIAGLPTDRLSGGASTITPYGRFGFGPAGTRLPNSDVAGNLTLIPGRAGTALGDFRVFRSEGDAFNFQPFVSLTMPSERTQVLTSARFALTDAIAVHADAFYAERRSEQRLGAPLLLTGIASAGLPRFAIPVSQAYNPFNAPVTRALLRLDGLERDFEQDVDTFRVDLGLDGVFEAGDRAIDWRLGAIRADIESHEIDTGVLDTTAIANALGPSFRDAEGVWRCGTNNVAIAGCVPLNIFGGPAGLTPAMLDYVATIAQQSAEVEQWQYYAQARTNLFELPAGAMRLDLGYRYRDEQGFEVPDAFIASGAAGIAGRVPVRADFSVDEFDIALHVPLLADAPLAQALSVSLAGDYSRYQNDHAAYSPGVSLNWAINPEWSLHLASDHGLREPSVRELGLGVTEFQFFGLDPCWASAQSPADVRERCRTGFGGVAPVPVGYDATDGILEREFTSGNAALAPERTREHTVSLAYRPEWLRGLTLDLTWYERDVRNPITYVDGRELLDRCYVRAQAQWCAEITRKPDGELDTVNGGLYNTDITRHVEGYELHAAHTYEAAFGRLSFDLLAHYLADWDRGDTDQGPVEFTSIGERNGTDGAIHRLRVNLGAGWQRGDFGVSLGARYYSAVDGACQAGLTAGTGSDFSGVCDSPTRAVSDRFYPYVPEPEDRADSTWFADAQVRWNAPWNAQLSLTVRNLFDEDAPTVYDGSEGNFDPQYPVPGRFWFIAYRQAF